MHKTVKGIYMKFNANADVAVRQSYRLNILIKSDLISANHTSYIRLEPLNGQPHVIPSRGV